MSSINFSFKNIKYNDTKDHFQNAVLRLLNLSLDDFYNWINLSDNMYNGSLIDSLSLGFHKYKNIQPYKNKFWFDYIYENNNYGLLLHNNIAYLCDNYGKVEINPPIYEDNYFEGDKLISGGYGDYLNQSSWRIEKSNRQLYDIKNITKLTSGVALDVGSGYGFFRKALENNNFIHYGVEISKFAANVSKTIYGFDSFVGNLYDFNTDIKFDLITLWDVIEHIPDTNSFFIKIFDLLKSDGILVVKTPNIYCPEVNIFGPYYHSFKREHLVYFSANGLQKICNNIGYKTIKLNSISHLLQGFIGKEECNNLENSLQGSDLICYFKK